MQRAPRLDISVIASLMAAIIAFGLDRAQKAFHIAAECYAVGQSVCVSVPYFFEPLSLTGWRGGEILSVTPFFDYVLVWNTGISYGLFDSLPVWALGVIMLVAIVALSFWWWRSKEFLVRLGLALCVGGGALQCARSPDLWGRGRLFPFPLGHVVLLHLQHCRHGHYLRRHPLVR